MRVVMNKNVFYILIFLMTFVCVACESNIPNDKLVFSVSDSTKVQFAPGNLQYVKSQDKWMFAANQWEMIGINNLTNPKQEINAWYSEDLNFADTIDMFAWGTGNNPTLSVSQDSMYKEFTDWGTNEIGNYSANYWRTLSIKEWEYLLFNRKDAKLLYGMAQVNGINGMILLPDGWEPPRKLDVLFIHGYHGSSSAAAYAWQQTFDLNQWKILERSGAIFLPASGYLTFLGDEGRLFALQKRGIYWSSTKKRTDGISIWFDPGDIFSCLEELSDKASVRLVRDYISY